MHGASAVEMLERLTAGAASYRLVTGNPHAAADALVLTLNRPPGAGAPDRC